MNLDFAVISEKGKRPGNEDFIFPLHAEPQIDLFIVCDGVGGANRGDVASKLVCEYLAEKYKDTKIENYTGFDADIFGCESQLQHHLSLNSDSVGMATTLALLKFQDSTAIVAHAGDSRVYHIREGQILHVTKDHSLVNELISTGYISEEEARTHPKKNIITKAITGDKNHTQVDISMIPDINTGDLFLLCSDGILEGINTSFIEDNFHSSSPPSFIIDLISKQCSNKSNDNYSAIVVKIQNE